MRGAWLRLLTGAGAWCAATLAYAAHPLISEDTGTQGSGKTELELGTSFTPGGGGHVFEFDPQLSYGLRDNLDIILRPSLFHLSGPAADEAGSHGGFGSTALDIKWRFVSEGPVSFGTRLGVDLPTATHDLGPNRAGWHALGMVTYFDEVTLATANVAYARVPDAPDVRRNLWRASAAYMRSVHPDVRLLADAAVFRSSSAFDNKWPAVMLVGAIFHAPAGFDVDVGYQFRLNDAAPASVWLAGVTFRW